MKNIKIILIAFLIIGFSSNQEAIAKNDTLSYQVVASNLTYSWSATFNAISYKIEIEHQGTAQKYSQETANTIATFSNLPSGTYDIKVTVTKTDGSTYIVIADESEL